MVLRRVKDRLQKFNVAVAEVEHQDLWQRATLGIVAISTTDEHVEQSLAAAADEIDRVEPGSGRREREIEFLEVMAQGHRPDRVGDQIRQELSELLSRGAVHDPGIGFITLTRVQVSPDLQLARVYYTTLGDAKARQGDGQGARARHAVLPPPGRRAPAAAARAGARVPLRRVDRHTRTASSRSCATCTRKKRSGSAPVHRPDPADDDPDPPTRR